MPSDWFLAWLTAAQSRAMRIFYCENSFRSTCINLDSSVATKFEDVFVLLKKKGALSEKDSCRHAFRYNFDADFAKTTSCWTNLMIWIRRVHGGNNVAYRFHETGKPAPGISSEDHISYQLSNKVVDSMFEMAKDFRDLPWNRVEKIFKYMHPGLEKIDHWFEVDSPE